MDQLLWLPRPLPCVTLGRGRGDGNTKIIKTVAIKRLWYTFSPNEIISTRRGVIYFLPQRIEVVHLYMYTILACPFRHDCCIVEGSLGFLMIPAFNQFCVTIGQLSFSPWLTMGDCVLNCHDVICFAAIARYDVRNALSRNHIVT